MAAIPSHPLLVKLHENRGMLFPLAFVSLLLVILIPLPPRVMAQLRRRGVAVSPEANSADLVEAIFAAQERFMRQPLGCLPGRDEMRLKGRLVS